MATKIKKNKGPEVEPSLLSSCLSLQKSQVLGAVVLVETHPSCPEFRAQKISRKSSGRRDHCSGLLAGRNVKNSCTWLGCPRFFCFFSESFGTCHQFVQRYQGHSCCLGNGLGCQGLSKNALIDKIYVGQGWSYRKGLVWRKKSTKYTFPCVTDRTGECSSNLQRG